MEEIRNTMPLIGEDAPAFEAVTTQGTIRFLKIIKGNGSFYFHTRQTLHLCVQQSL